MRTDFISSVKEDFGLTDLLGYGADGDVYLTNRNTAVKFSFLYDYHYEDPLSLRFEKIENVIKFIIQNKPKEYVPIIDFKVLKYDNRDFYIDNIKTKQNYVVYCYEMILCDKINTFETKLFHSILAEDKRGFKKNYKSIVSELSLFFDINDKLIFDFVDSVNESKISHRDLLPQNIMKLGGEYKLIDLDRVDFK